MADLRCKEAENFGGRRSVLEKVYTTRDGSATRIHKFQQSGALFQ
jgi:hypothetical protein